MWFLNFILLGFCADCLLGDGAWGMSLNELMTCVRENIPITVCVFHNAQWGAEKKNQVLWFGDRYVGVNLDNPSFAAIAGMIPSTAGSGSGSFEAT